MNTGAFKTARRGLPGFDAGSTARALLSAALVAAALQQTAFAVQSGNLLANSGFEAGTTHWTLVSGAVTAVTYGTSPLPTSGFGAQFGLGGWVLRDNGSGAVVEQLVQTGPIAPGVNVRASGFFGGTGTSPDQARLVVRYLGATQQEIRRDPLEFVSTTARNGENVLVKCEAVLAPPAGTVTIAAQIEFDNLTFGSFALADQIELELTTTPLTPPALPIGTQLLANPSFDAGWTTGSPLTPENPSGWRGRAGRCLTQAYTIGTSDFPGTEISSVYSGGASFLRSLDTHSTFEQTFDVRGNATQIQNGLQVLVSAFLGGSTQRPDTAGVVVDFLTSTGALVGPTRALGPVTPTERNYQTLLMKRSARFDIPPTTAFVRVGVVFTDGVFGGEWGFADKLSVTLENPAPISPLSLDVNLVHNPGFENGSLVGSPIVLDDPDGWQGGSAVLMQTALYGSSTTLPSASFSIQNQLGGNLLRSTGNGQGKLVQVRSLEGFAAEIANGTLLLEASAWLGGHSNSLDTPQVDVVFLGANGLPLGLPTTLGPVTASMRAGLTTLLYLNQAVNVPLGAERFSVAVTLEEGTTFQNYAYADEISVVLRDVSPIGTSYCPALANSSGGAAVLSASGSASVSANDLVWRATPVPNPTTGRIFYGNLQVNVPTSSGILCVGGIRRLPVVVSNGSTLIYAMNFQLSPLVQSDLQPGTTWNFQAWFRDPLAGGAASGFSSAYQVTLQP